MRCGSAQALDVPEVRRAFATLWRLFIFDIRFVFNGPQISSPIDAFMRSQMTESTFSCNVSPKRTEASVFP
jgi:hypothetical protein